MAAPRFGLGIKVALIASAIVIFIGAGLFGVVAYEQRVTFQEIRTAEMMEDVRKTAFHAENHLYNYNIRELRNIAAGIMEGRRVDLVWILDSEGRILSDGKSQPALRNKRPQIGFIDRLLAGGVARTEADKTNLWAGTPVLLSKNEILGYVVAAVPMEEFNNAIWSTIRKQSVVLGLALISGIFAAILFGQRIAAPVEALREAADRIGHGDWDFKLEIDRQDEIGDLAKSINVMAERLNEGAVTRDRLQALVDEKTAEISLHRDKLEAQVMERTRELQLAKDAAERASRAKSEFLSSMSHELRTPLNAILGFGQLLEYSDQSGMDSEQRQAVDYINNSGEHLLNLINQVLDFNKIEDGNLGIHLESFNPVDEVHDCLAIASAMAAKHDVSIELKKGVESCPVIRADRTRFKQVLLNLLTNGIKYNRPGGSVSLNCDVLGGRYLRLIVSDTGKGIAADQQHLLFEPFQRLGHESSSIEGTGIGLTITKKLVNLMRGRIGFESEEAKGSEFWIDFPLDRSRKAEPEKRSADRPESAADPLPAATLRPDGAKRSTLLYVEDNADNVRLMEMILDREDDFTLVSAPNAEEGLELAAQIAPDVILMDINLPGMDGFKALNALQAQRNGRHVPVIAVTASALPAEVQRGLDAGFAAYLTKPIRIDVTLSAIRNAVAGNEQGMLR